MQTHDAPQNLLDECYETLKEPEPQAVDRETGAICGALGLAVLLLMFLIATGTVPLYDWPA